MAHLKTTRIYQPGNYTCGSLLELSPPASQHVGVVLRMQAGEKLTLFRGDKQEFTAVILNVQKKTVHVRIEQVMTVHRESACQIHLAQAISKGDRMDFVIQKAVELGAVSITPLLTERCVVRLDETRQLKKIQQWQAIAISACEQSGRNCVPPIHPVIKLEDYLAFCRISHRFVLDPAATHSWRSYVFPMNEIAVLIGPEGGLSNAEIQQALAAKFNPLCLGPRVLRTETAALAALSLLQGVSGDL